MPIKKESILIFVLFLLFFPMYALFNNTILFLFDQIFTSGEVSKLFNYNFYGEYLGCLGSVKYQELYENYNFIQRHGALIIQFLISVVSFIILVKNNFKKPVYKWLLAVVFSFFLFSSLWFLSNFFYYQGITNLEFLKRVYVIVICSTIELLLAIYLFFKCFNKKEKIQILSIAFPASVISAYIWFAYLGPIVLPL